MQDFSGNNRAAVSINQPDSDENVPFLQAQEPRRDEESNLINSGGDVSSYVASSLVYLSGLVRAEDQFKLERLLFRITRGKALTFAESLPQE